jgi:hypothetical protein
VKSQVFIKKFTRENRATVIACIPNKIYYSAKAIRKALAFKSLSKLEMPIDFASISQPCTANFNR